MRLALKASERLNPDDKGQSLPTVIKIYLLKTPAKLVAATFEDLLQREQETLGGDFITGQELTLSPGQQAESKLTRDPAGEYLAVVGLFRDPKEASWRSVRRLSPPDLYHCRRKPGAAPAPLRFLLEESRVEDAP